MGGNVAEAARDVENGACLYGGSMAIHSEKKAWGSLEAWRLGVVGVWSWPRGVGSMTPRLKTDQRLCRYIVLYKHITSPPYYLYYTG